MVKDLDYLRSINLPSPVSTFIGREQEIATVRGLILENRLITLIGAGGSGKTRLALQTVYDLLEQFKNKIWFVELATVRDASLISQKIVSTLNLQNQSGRLPLELLVHYLSPRTSLLILDNCEHLIAACTETTDSLLQQCADLKILVTSRERMGITGEAAWIVPPLSLPEKQPWMNPASAGNALRQYEKFESIQLFVARARTNFPEFELTTDNGAWVAEICRRLDGMPLAIELAAARVRYLSVQEIAKRLDDRFALLTRGNHTAPDRQQTLAATIDWSYDLLSETAQRLLWRFSVFAGSGSLEAIEAVCTGEGVEKSEVFDTFLELVDKSLVTADPRSSETRYSLLETVREYALEKLAVSGEMKSVKDRHLDFYVRLAEEAEPKLKGPEEFIWYKRLKDEHNNFRIALAWALESQNIESGIRLTNGLVHFWTVYGYLGEGIDWMEKVLPHREEVSSHLKADALKNLGCLLLWREEKPFVRSAKLLEECLTLYRQLGNETGVAWVLNRLGLIAIGSDDYERGRNLLNESLNIHQILGNPWSIADTLEKYYLLAGLEKDLAALKKYSKKYLDWYKKAGYQSGLVGSLIDLGDIARLEGNPTLAIEYYKQGLAKCLQYGERLLLADHFEWLAAALNEAGRHERAACLFGAAEAIREMFGLPVRRIDAYEKKVSAIRINLDDEIFSQLWEEGRKMSLEQVLDYVNEEHESVPPVLREKENINNLTPREHETAILISKGKSNREIAEAMTVMVKTVEAYITRINRKLGFVSRVQIATWVMDNEIT